MHCLRWATIAALSLSACHGEPPAPSAVEPSVAPMPSPDRADDVRRPSTRSNDASSPTDAGEGNSDAGVDPGTLPQTQEKPSSSNDAFASRASALWDGIASDDPDKAMPFFFPVTAYEQVKAIPNAPSDWKRRLVAAYARDIHALHKRLGAHAAQSKLLRVEIPQERARWVETDEESNKLGYYRVYGSRLIYEVDGDGKRRSFDVSSLISWRGEWYVVHLTGFK